MPNSCLTILLCAALAGCSSGPPNPSFPVTTRQARAILREMKADPKPLDRPVVVVAGLLDPGFNVSTLAGTLRKAATQADVTTVTFFGLNTRTFDGCRDYLIDAVERAFGETGTKTTIEVDVIGFSMGGLVARHASRPREDGKRLVIRRLFTICTPHRGARLAEIPTLDRRSIDMRSGSAFLDQLDGALADADFEMYSYTRLGDLIVGEENAAPPGETPWWVPTPPLSFAHLNAATDPRIMADITRRLRGEEPLATRPPAPFDGDAEAAPRVAGPRREGDEVPDISGFDGTAPAGGT